MDNFNFSKNSTPPFFYSPIDRMIQRPAFSSLDLPKHLIEFICLIIDCSATNDYQPFDIHYLQLHLSSKQLKHGRPLIEKRVRELTKYGLLDSVDVKRPGKRKCSCYNLSEPKLVSTHKFKDHRSAVSEIVNYKKSLATNASVLSLSELDGRKIRSESFMTGILDKALRTNPYDSRRTITSQVKINVEDSVERISVTSSCGSDGDLMILSDQAIVRAVLSLCSQMIEQRQNNPNFNPISDQIPNTFILDIVDLCKLVGDSSAGSARTTIRSALVDRIRNTEWLIDAKPDGWFAKHFMKGFDQHYFRLFSSFSVANDIDFTERRNPRLYKFSLNDFTFNSLLDPNVRRIFKAHPAICHLRLGIIQSLYSYLRIKIGGNDSDRGNRFIKRSLESVRRDIFPSYTNKQAFLRDFVNQLSKYSCIDIDLKHKGNVYHFKFIGYKLSLAFIDEDNSWYLGMERDIDDPITGNQSYNNYVLDYQSNKQLTLLN